MTLEDIVKAGEDEKKVREIIEDFRKNTRYNVVLALGEVDKSNDLYAKAGIDPKMTSSLNPVQMNDFASEIHGEYQGKLVQKVQEDPSAVIAEIGKGEKGLERLADFILQYAPVQYNGVNAEVYEAHEKVQKERKALENPEKKYKEVKKQYEGCTAGKAILFMFQQHPELARQIIESDYHDAVRSFKAKLGNSANASSYIAGMYASADDKAKMDIAYSLGVELADPIAERPKKAQQARNSAQQEVIEKPIDIAA